MGLKMGLFLGFIVGSALAGLIGKKIVAEAPASDQTLLTATSGAQQTLREAIDRVRLRANQAIEAAHEAADEKEAELRRRYRHLSEKEA